MSSKITYLARSGYKGAIILALLLGVALFLGFNHLAFVFAVALVGWVYMFRNPERVALHLSDNALLAPIDGEIKQIQSIGDKCFITIESRIFDVGVIRSPLNIQNYQISQVYGIPLYFSQKRSFFNSKVEFCFGENKMTFFPQLLHFSPLKSSITTLERGERMGFMKGEVQMEIKNLETKLNVGDKVKGGESVLGYLQ